MSRARISTTPSEGFTLVELLVVLVIVSISLGMVAFSFAGASGEDALQAEAEGLARWVRATIDHAAEEGEGVVLRYDIDAGVFSAVPAAGNSGAPIAECRLRSPIRIQYVVQLRKEEVRKESGCAQALVFPRGNCEPHLIVLGHPGDGMRTLEVNPVTGDVAVLQGARDYERVSGK